METRVVVFHYSPAVRSAVSEALRAAGAVAYAAEDTAQAWEAINSLKPDVVVTDFPAFMPPEPGGAPTLTEAIRSHPELDGIAVLNLRGSYSTELGEYASSAGVTASLPASAPLDEIVSRVCSMPQESADRRSRTSER